MCMCVCVFVCARGNNFCHDEICLYMVPLWTHAHDDHSLFIILPFAIAATTVKEDVQVTHNTCAGGQQKDSFGDLLSGFGMAQPAPAPVAQPALPAEEPEEISPGTYSYFSFLSFLLWICSEKPDEISPGMYS